MPHRNIFIGIFLVAFSTLLVEVSIIRVLSFTIWHHFGYVIISTALLGYGASGTLLALAPQIGKQDLRRTLASLSLLSAATTVAVLGFVAAVPLEPTHLFNDPLQAVIFLAYLVLTAVPFFFSGLAITLALRAAAQYVDRLYFWDLVGGALGCAVAVALMNAWAPPGAVVFAGGSFAAAAAVFAPSRIQRLAGVTFALGCLVGAQVASDLPFTPAASKHLSIQLRAMGMVPVSNAWTALFRTDLIENVNPKPDSCEAGASRLLRRSDCEKPRHYIAHDASAGAGIYDMTGSPRLHVVDRSILRTPYVVAPPKPRVLVIGVGGGRDVVVARQHGASHVTGVEIDPLAIGYLREQLLTTRHEFQPPDVEFIVGEGRHYARSTDQIFDLIQMTGVDTLAAEYSGAYVLSENYLYSSDSFQDYFQRLGPGGILSIATGNLNPNSPRASGRMVSVARHALLAYGIKNPGQHIVVIDSRTILTSILVRLQPFTRPEVQRLLDFSKEQDFLPLHLPGRRSHPLFDGLASSSGAERERLLAGQKHRIDATTDDRPFFFSFYHWGSLFQEGSLNPSHVTALGQIIIGVMIIALTVLGGLLILAPLVAFNRRAEFPSGTLPLLGYFLAVGFGFMLFEISLIQRFVLFLGYPTYSLTVTLFSLLTFLGLGSFLSKRWVGHERVVLPAAAAAIGCLALFYGFGLPPIQNALLGESLAVRIALSVAVLMPLGLVLGLFFPLGVRLAADIHEDLVPWAWAVNGCASVTASVATIALAMTFGFSRVWAASVVVYALGVACFLVALRHRPVTSP